MKPSPLGPLRKYYYLEDAGRKELIGFINAWMETKENIENVLSD
jgi:PadR family transcriptional regulator PadR